MGITVYGRRLIRRWEGQTGERIVHAAGAWLTTIDHRHLEWTGHDDGTDRWAPMATCPPLSSCLLMFGRDEHGARQHFMLGACSKCDAAPGQGHRHDCGVLLDLLSWKSINPDYWPRPVHRPMWTDDPRRRAPNHSVRRI